MQGEILDSLTNVTLEQMILGIILNNNNCYDAINSIINSSMFSNNKHVFLYENYVKLLKHGQPVNLATLYPIITSNTHYNITVDYIKEITSNVYGSESIVKYCESLRDLFLRRRILGILENSYASLKEFSLDKKVENIIEKIENDIFQVVDKHETKAVTRLGDSAINFVEKLSKRTLGEITGIDTGFIELNELLGGLQRGELVVLAGRPSMGKTDFAVNLGTNAARYGKKPYSVLFFSLEMPEEQITMRILARAAKINSFKLRSGHQNTDESARLHQRAREIYDTKFFVDDAALNTITNMRITSRRIKRIHGLDLIIVDYLQLIKSEDGHGAGNRTLELASITQGLKSIAKELNVCVLALSQLSRAVESREDKRPQLSDLRESGAIEQDSDVVMFIYREEYYLKRKEPKENKKEEWLTWKDLMSDVENSAEIIVDKNRNGSIGVVKLYYDMTISTFNDW